MESSQAVTGCRLGGWRRRGRRCGEGGAGVERGADVVVEGWCCSCCCGRESLGLDDSDADDDESAALDELEGFGASIAAAEVESTIERSCWREKGARSLALGAERACNRPRNFADDDDGVAGDDCVGGFRCAAGRAPGLAASPTAHGRIEARWEAGSGTCALSGSQGGKASSCKQKGKSFFFYFCFPQANVWRKKKYIFFLFRLRLDERLPSKNAAIFPRLVFKGLAFTSFRSPTCSQISTRPSLCQSLGFTDRRKKHACERGQ